MVLAKLKQILPGGNVGTYNSLLDVCAKRVMYVESIPDIMTLNFLNFAPKYKTANNKLTPQPENTESRVFPIYSWNKKGSNFSLTVNINCLHINPGRQHNKTLGVISQVMMKYMSQNENNFWKLLVLKRKMFLTGMTSYEVFKITVMMTQLLKKPHKNFLHMKNGCSYQISFVDHLLQLINHSKLLTRIITGNQTHLNIKKIK